MRSDRGGHATADEIAASLEGIYDTEKLVQELLARIFDFVPAERGAVLIAGPDAGDLQRTMFRGSSFTLQRELAQNAFRERKALLHRDAHADVLCAPLCMRRSTVGPLYLESSRAAVLNVAHLRLVALVAAEIAPQVECALGQSDPGGMVEVDFLPDSVWDEPEENASLGASVK